MTTSRTAVTMSVARTLLVVVALGGLVAGCGGSGGGTSDAAAVQVIRGWSEALQSGHIGQAAHYFALPSKMENGGVLTIHTHAQAYAANEALPCGARLISTARHGRYVHAVFRLTNRRGPDASCAGGVGETAATDFVITHGRIVQWVRAPVVESGGGAKPGTPTVQQTTTPVV